ncbi:M50 family metallopeptidase [Paenibacillus hamazuiensis]|uniref:M50 family metallopeptidase n=1 Tax=Paenibacillus hamazuiensis TaxID=2936508 RepID=UPI00200D2493|nr:M50 family metallopeptidase [Paenibacillus hamazuiensis]
MIKWAGLEWGGFRFRFHPLFSILLLFSVITGYAAEMLILFGIVLIHELGHLTAAKGFGWQVREIQLLPFGGVLVVDEPGTVPAWEEIAVALAGPLQNVLMIAFAAACKWAGLWSGGWWDYFMQANLIIALFNLMPVLPLDGGKIMQSLLSYHLPYHRAIQWCAAASLVVSLTIVGMAFLRIGSHGIKLNVLIIGLFLIFSNWHTYRSVPYLFLRFLMHREARAGGFIVKGALAQPIVVNGRRKVADILRLFIKEKYHLIYVMDERGVIRAVLPEQRLLHTYFVDKKPGCAVSELLM